MGGKKGRIYVDRHPIVIRTGNGGLSTNIFNRLFYCAHMGSAWALILIKFRSRPSNIREPLHQMMAMLFPVRKSLVLHVVSAGFSRY
jgi:hypothetical protein